MTTSRSTDHPVVSAQIAVDQACERVRAILEALPLRESVEETIAAQHVDTDQVRRQAVRRDRHAWMDGHRRAMCEIALILQAVDLPDAEKLKRIGWWVQSV